MPCAQKTSVEPHFGQNLNVRPVFLGLRDLLESMLFFAFFPNKSLEQIFLGEFWFFHTWSIHSHTFHPLVLWGFKLLRLVGSGRISQERLGFGFNLVASP